jgi:hypothetical protein
MFDFASASTTQSPRPMHKKAWKNGLCFQFAVSPGYFYNLLIRFPPAAHFVLQKD